jgi:predicted adenylyl cyclase CyaB
MAANIEIKARVPDPDRLRTLVEKISGRPSERIVQEDVFFHCPGGRLKLRILARDDGELIYYRRADSTGPSRSDYFIHSTSDPGSLRAILDMSLGTRAVVRKIRLLHLWGQTRIHLDEVEGLGSFLELEVVLGSDQNDDDGMAIARQLMKKLEIDKADLVDCAYVDLIDGAER